MLNSVTHTTWVSEGKLIRTLFRMRHSYESVELKVLHKFHTIFLHVSEGYWTSQGCLIEHLNVSAKYRWVVKQRNGKRKNLYLPFTLGHKKHNPMRYTCKQKIYNCCASVGRMESVRLPHPDVWVNITQQGSYNPELGPACVQWNSVLQVKVSIGTLPALCALSTRESGLPMGSTPWTAPPRIKGLSGIPMAPQIFCHLAESRVNMPSPERQQDSIPNRT